MFADPSDAVVSIVRAMVSGVNESGVRCGTPMVEAVPEVVAAVALLADAFVADAPDGGVAAPDDGVTHEVRFEGCVASVGVDVIIAVTPPVPPSSLEFPLELVLVTLASSGPEFDPLEEEEDDNEDDTDEEEDERRVSVVIERLAKVGMLAKVGVSGCK